MSEDKLRQRLWTVAELKLLDIEIDEILNELIQDYGQSKIELMIAQMGLLSVLGGMRGGVDRRDFDR